MMLSKTVLEEVHFISFTENSVIKFKNGFQFTLVPEVLEDKYYVFRFQDFIGDFEIVKVEGTRLTSFGRRCIRNTYDKITKTCKFVQYTDISREFYFSLSADVEFKEVDYVKVEYDLKFAASRIQLLDYLDCYSFVIELPGYEYLKFNTHIKKFKNDYSTLIVENPYNLRLNGEKGNFEYETINSNNVYQHLSFIFDPNTVTKTPQAAFNLNSRPESVLSTSSSTVQLENAFTSKLSLHDVLSNTKYADIIFISRDNKRLPSLKCVIAKHSEKLGKVIAKITKNPAEIVIDKYDSKTISAALDFCHGKIGPFNEKENLMMDLLKFAKEYEFSELSETCCMHFEETVGPKNVCEIVSIAYLYKFVNLKQKCKQIMNEFKTEIDSENLKKLSSDILIDVYCR